MFLNKVLNIRIIICIILSFISFNTKAQFFNQEQNPLSVKWRQINTQGFKIIFAAEIENEAQRLANTLPLVYRQIGLDFKLQKTSLPLILQNQGTLANGFVQLAPKKSEFYTTPPLDFDSQDWLNNLAVHELRHVAQFDKITGTIHPPFPEEINFAYIGLALPIWAVEGDAVNKETTLTLSGRGRQPAWIMPYRTQLLSGKNPTYSKAYFGSDKNPEIGYYQLGYLMVTKLHNTYGSRIIDSIFSEINKRPLRLYPFSNTLKKITGKNTKQLFTEMQTAVKNIWQIQDPGTYSKFKSGSPQSDFEINYYLPTPLPDNKTLALLQSNNQTGTLAMLDSTLKVNTLFKIGYQDIPWFSYAAKKIVWNEIHYDPRYKQRNYSTLYIYDIEKKKFKQLSKHSKYFSPSLSPDGKKIITVNYDLSNRCNIVEIDAETGIILKEITKPQHTIIQFPTYNSDCSKVVFIVVSEMGKSLIIQDLETQKKDTLITHTRQQISKPKFDDKYIIFNGHFNGIDNIYTISIQTKEVFQLTNAQFGAFNASIGTNNKIIYNQYTPLGYSIAIANKEYHKIGIDSFAYLPLNEAIGNNYTDLFNSIPNEKFTSTPYSPFSNLFHIHSISPDINEKDQFGIALKATNLLNTLEGRAGLYYNSDLQKISSALNIDFKALYPIISIKQANTPELTYIAIKGQQKAINYHKNEAELKITIPFSWNDRNSNYYLNLNAGTSYVSRFTEEKGITFQDYQFPLQTGFQVAHLTHTAKRNLNAPWGQIIEVNQHYHFTGKNQTDRLFSLNSLFYFPGIFPNHSLSISFNYQNAEGVYKYSNQISEVYGYKKITSLGLLKNTLLINYQFPIAYPDLELGSIAYIRTLKGKLFMHYENLNNQQTFSSPKTFGFELRSTLNALRYLPIVDMGIRMIFVNKIYDKRPIAEFLLKLNL